MSPTHSPRAVRGRRNDAWRGKCRRRAAYAPPVRSGAEVAVFVTRRNGSEVLVVHRSPIQGSYWHVVAGGVEPGETAREAAERELREETGLVATVTGGAKVTEYVYPLTEEPAERRQQYDASVVEVEVTCFQAEAPDTWEPRLDWEHDDYRWCDPTHAFESLRWPETAQALKQLLIVEPG
jgi:8-oxo-dGTP pyrophosphatase MutT (NUDIX family)